MSNNYQEWDDEDDFDMDEVQPKRDDSTDLVRKLRKAERAKEKRIRELEDELGSLRSAQRENVIKSVLSEKGVNPKIAAFIPSTLDASSEAVSAWIEEYGDVFGLKSATNDDPAQQVPDLSALRQIDAVTSGALSPDRQEDMFLRLNQAGSAEEIIDMINSFDS